MVSKALTAFWTAGVQSRIAVRIIAIATTFRLVLGSTLPRLPGTERLELVSRHHSILLILGLVNVH
jgi:hypothetical protein